MLGLRRITLVVDAILRCPVCGDKIPVTKLDKACPHFVVFDPTELVGTFHAPEFGEDWRAFAEADCPVCGQRVFLNDVKDTACKHLIQTDQPGWVATFETPDPAGEIIRFRDVQKYLVDRGVQVEWVNVYPLGYVEVPAGWRVHRTWAACPECTKLKERQDGHLYCYNPNWADKVLRYEGLILDGPTYRGTDWVVYFAAKD